MILRNFFRELAKQVAGDFESIAPKLAVLTVYGGVGFEEQSKFKIISFKSFRLSQ